MAECSECGKKSMSFTCHYCGDKFCSKHRLPENHDCTGLESGKKEKFKSSTSQEKNQKWFDDKFKDKKEPQRQKKQFKKPGFLNEAQRILKSNITLVVIALTGFTFLLQQSVPFLENLFSLSPALSDAAVQATNQAAQNLGFQGDILTKTFPESLWTVITVLMVHGSFVHIAANMITFYFFGTAVEKTIGGLEMLKIYLVAGIGSSIAYVVFRNILYLIHGPLSGNLSLAPAVGASGAVVAMFSLVAMLYPKAEVLLYFIVPMKIKTAFQLFAGIEVMNLLTTAAGFRLPIIGGFASSAHLAGLAIGLYYGKKLQNKYGRNTGLFDPLGY